MLDAPLPGLSLCLLFGFPYLVVQSFSALLRTATVYHLHICLFQTCTQCVRASLQCIGIVYYIGAYALHVLLAYDAFRTLTL